MSRPVHRPHLPGDDCPYVECQTLQPEIQCPSWCTVEKHLIGERGGRMIVHAARFGAVEVTETVDPGGDYSSYGRKVALLGPREYEVVEVDDLLSIARDLEDAARLLYGAGGGA